MQVSALKVVVGIGLAAAAIGMIAETVSSGRRAADPASAPPVAVPVSVTHDADVIVWQEVDPAVATSHAPRLPLPTKRIDVHALLGKPRAVAEGILGRADPDVGFFDVGKAPDDINLYVMYDTGLVANVMMVRHEELEGDASDQVIAWANLSTADDIDLTGLPSHISVWAPGARARYTRRLRIATKVGKLLALSDAGASARVVDGDRLLIIPSAGDKSCDRRTLAKLRDVLTGWPDGDGGRINLKADGFGSMQCDEGGVLQL